MDRRTFLNTSWKILGLGLVVEAGWTSYDLLKPPKSSAFGGLVDAGSIADYMEEGAVQYFLDGRFYVTMYQGGLRALYQKCPHLGCRIPFCESSDQFECPCHGSTYNVIGEYLTGPAPRGMDRFPITISGDRVVVDTSTVVLGPERGELTGPNETAGPSCVSEGASGGSASGASGEAAGRGSDEGAAS
jgi:cytochrome b6-f complex iron-sulfur subunit